MNFIEFLGFVISLAALIFLSFRQAYEARKRRMDPHEYARKEKERNDKWRSMMRQQGIDVGEDLLEPPVPKPRNISKPPKSPPVSTPQHMRQSKQAVASSQILRPDHSDPYFKDHMLQSNMKPAEKYEVIRIKENPMGNKIIRDLKSPREMFVIKEVLDKPLSMRNPHSFD